MTASANTEAPERAVFRLPWVSVLFPFLLFFCATPLATVRWWMLWLYLIPLAALVYVLITRTEVNRVRIRRVSLTGARTIAWESLDGFEFRGPRWAVAVTTDGRRFRLPMVRPRDMPLVARVSGGWINLDPPAPEADAAEADSAEVEPVEAEPTAAEPDPAETGPGS